MKKLWTLLGALAMFVPIPALAVGTAAGTSISNTASVSYEVGGTPVSADSNTDTITVDELIDVEVTSLNASNVAVATPSTDRVLTFEVTNIGNGVEDFELFVTNRVSDQFDVTNLELYLDTNGNGIYDSGVDTAFTTGSGGDSLNLDANGATDAQVVFVVADIPGGQTDNDLANVQLEAVSITASDNGLTLAGDTAVGQGDGGGDAVVDGSAGRDSDQGTYVVASIEVTIVKASVVDDPFGGNVPVPGATITYTLTVTVDGTATATDLLVSDPIPANTTYVSSSITLDTNGGGAVAQDDADDGGDEGYFDPSSGADGTVFVDLGDVSGDPIQTFEITFQVVID